MNQLDKFKKLKVTPLSLLFRAFGVLGPQIIVAPGWVSTERYDVVAVTAGVAALDGAERTTWSQAGLSETTDRSDRNR